MHLPHRTTLLAIVLCSAAASLPAQTVAVDPSGHWEGSAELQGMQLNFDIDLARNSQGELAGTFGSAAQNLKGLPLSNFAVEGRAIRFQIKGAVGERAFKCTLSADGKSISGDYFQNGYSMPFSMTRTGDARFEAAVKNAPIGKELEGTWNGTLAADGKQLRVVLTLSNQSDGTATGNMVSVDEGLDVPIATITQKGSSLALDLKAVGASYSAVLSPDGAELSGTYTQASLSLPLILRRAAAAEAEK